MIIWLLATFVLPRFRCPSQSVCRIFTRDVLQRPSVHPAGPQQGTRSVLASQAFTADCIFLFRFRNNPWELSAAVCGRFFLNRFAIWKVAIHSGCKLVFFPSSNPKTNCSQELCFVKWQLQSRLTISSFSLSQQFLYVDASGFFVLFYFVFTERRRIQFLVISKKTPILLVFPCRGFHFVHQSRYYGTHAFLPISCRWVNLH